jgi:hypothetical protein
MTQLIERGLQIHSERMVASLMRNAMLNSVMAANPPGSTKYAIAEFIMKLSESLPLYTPLHDDPDVNRSLTRLVEFRTPMTSINDN